MKSLDPKKFDKYLPIGSVVMLNNGIKTLMIIGYQKKGEDKKTYEYFSILFPEGVLTDNKVFLFNHDDISIIFHLGYMSKSYVEFDKILKKESKNYSFIDKDIIDRIK